MICPAGVAVGIAVQNGRPFHTCGTHTDLGLISGTDSAKFEFLIPLNGNLTALKQSINRYDSTWLFIWRHNSGHLSNRHPKTFLLLARIGSPPAHEANVKLFGC